MSTHLVTVTLRWWTVEPDPAGIFGLIRERRHIEERSFVVADGSDLESLSVRADQDQDFIAVSLDVVLRDPLGGGS